MIISRISFKNKDDVNFELGVEIGKTETAGGILIKLIINTIAEEKSTDNDKRAAQELKHVILKRGFVHKTERTTTTTTTTSANVVKLAKNYAPRLVSFCGLDHDQEKTNSSSQKNTV